MSRSLTASALRRSDPAASTSCAPGRGAQRVDELLGDRLRARQQPARLRRPVVPGGERLEQLLLRLGAEPAQAAQLLRLGRGAELVERVDPELVVEPAGALGTEPGQVHHRDHAARELRAQLDRLRHVAGVDQRLELGLQRLADAGQLGDLAVARELLDGDRRLAHGLGGGAVGEDAVGDGPVELVEVGELLEGGGDLGVRHGVPSLRGMRLRLALLTALLTLVPAGPALAAAGGGSSGFGGGGGGGGGFGGGGGGFGGGGAGAGAGSPVFILVIFAVVLIVFALGAFRAWRVRQPPRRARAPGRARLRGRGRRRPGVRRRRRPGRRARAVPRDPARLGRARPRPARAARRAGPARGVAAAARRLRAPRLAQPRRGAGRAADPVRRARQPRRRRRRPRRRLHHVHAARLRGDARRRRDPTATAPAATRVSSMEWWTLAKAGDGWRLESIEQSVEGMHNVESRDRHDAVGRRAAAARGRGRRARDRRRRPRRASPSPSSPTSTSTAPRARPRSISRSPTGASTPT